MRQTIPQRLTTGSRGDRAHSARYYRVYVKSVHKGRQQKNSYLRPFGAGKRGCSRRGNPCGCPGVGGHKGRPYTKQLSYAQFLDRHGSRVRLRTISLPRLCGARSAPYEFWERGKTHSAQAPVGWQQWAKASRSSRSLGGLLRTRSTWSGTSPSASRR